MGLKLGDTYWTYDNGTANIVSHGKIGQIRSIWKNGARNDITALFSTAKGQRTPAGDFVLSVYKYNKWHEVNRLSTRSYYSWVRWSFWIEGYYNRWFKVDFAGETRLFQVGTITNPDFIPWELEEEIEEDGLWETAINNVKSLITDLTDSFKKESVRVDQAIEEVKTILGFSIEKVTSDTEKMVTDANDSLYNRFKNLVDSAANKSFIRISEAFTAIEGVYNEIEALYKSVDNVLDGINRITESLKAVAVQTIISYAWYVIDRILESEIEEQEVNEDGRNIYRDGE